jgi:cob(I)alamin adenosyltransferase
MDFQGRIQVYTGNGKGKTTAALGLALRAAGRGMKTFMAQFLKKGEYGELLAVRDRLADLIVIEQFGLPEFHHIEDGVSAAEVEAAEAGLAAAGAALAAGEYRIVVLDEINTLLHFQIVAVEPVLRLIEKKPADVELVLTGRYAPRAILDRADLVTEMKEIRHYFQENVQARTGIEK